EDNYLGDRAAFFGPRRFYEMRRLRLISSGWSEDSRLRIFGRVASDLRTNFADRRRNGAFAFDVLERNVLREARAAVHAEHVLVIIGSFALRADHRFALLINVRYPKLLPADINRVQPERGQLVFLNAEISKMGHIAFYSLKPSVVREYFPDRRVRILFDVKCEHKNVLRSSGCRDRVQDRL